jgi:hypothetical protein
MHHFRTSSDTHLVFGEVAKRLAIAVARAKDRRRARKRDRLLRELTTRAATYEDALAARDLRVAGVMLRFMQLLCEGQYTEMQGFLAVQHGAAKSHDLILSTVTLLLTLEKCADAELLPLLIAALEALIEAVQGPMATNQRIVAAEKGIDAAARITMWTNPEIEARGIAKDSPAFAAARDASVRLLRAVIEGPPNASVHGQMAKALDYGLLRSRLARLYKAAVQRYSRGGGGGGGGIVAYGDGAIRAMDMLVRGQVRRAVCLLAVLAVCWSRVDTGCFQMCVGFGPYYWRAFTAV